MVLRAGSLFIFKTEKPTPLGVSAYLLPHC